MSCIVLGESYSPIKKCSYHGRILVLCGLKLKNIRILKILDFVLDWFEKIIATMAFLGSTLVIIDINVS
jgi:hypothetical protein